MIRGIEMRAVRIERLALLLLATCLACGGESGDGPTPRNAAAPSAPPAAAPAPSTTTAAAEATQVFDLRCVTCHGERGAGDGPGSQGLSPAPRDFRDPAWQDSVSDEHLTRIVLYGGAAVGRSPAMPGNPDLISKPDVMAALVKHVRELRASN
jgi:cytochrome c